MEIKRGRVRRQKVEEERREGTLTMMMMTVMGWDGGYGFARGGGRARGRPDHPRSAWGCTGTPIALYGVRSSLAEAIITCTFTVSYEAVLLSCYLIVAPHASRGF